MRYRPSPNLRVQRAASAESQRNRSEHKHTLTALLWNRELGSSYSPTMVGEKERSRLHQQFPVRARCPFRSPRRASP